MKIVKGSKAIKKYGVFYHNGRYLLNTYASKFEARKQAKRQLSPFEHGKITIRKV